VVKNRLHIMLDSVVEFYNLHSGGSMKRTRRFSLSVLPLALAALALLSSGCSSKPSDNQLAANVQSKVGADPALQGQPISVTAKDGSVTLTGTVNGQGSRELAANDAAKVQGVRTVINDLSIGNTAAGAPPPEASNQQTENIAPPPPPPGETAPAAPAQAQSIVIPAGTRIRVRLGQTLSTRDSQTGQSFSGTLVSPVRVDGQTIIRAGAQARGVVTDAKSQGRFKGQAVLAIRLDSVRADGRTYPVRTSRVERVEKGKGKRSAVMTGGGAGLGAIIGGVAGGGKGALIGGLLGGGGGAAGSAFTGNKDLVLPAESVLTFDLERSVTINR
jgi:hypothetical protein